MRGVSQINIIGGNFKDNHESAASATDSVSIWKLEHTAVYNWIKIIVRGKEVRRNVWGIIKSENYCGRYSTRG